MSKKHIISDGSSNFQQFKNFDPLNPSLIIVHVSIYYIPYCKAPSYIHVHVVAMFQSTYFVHLALSRALFCPFPYLSSSSFLWFWLLHFLILYCLSPFPSISSRNSHQPWYLDHGGLPSNLLLASGGQHRHPSACKGVKDAPIIKFKPLMWFFRPCSEMLFLIYSRRTNL